MSKPGVLKDNRFNGRVLQTHPNQVKASARKRQIQEKRRRAENAEAARQGISVIELRAWNEREAEHFRHTGTNPFAFEYDSSNVLRGQFLRDMAREYHW